MPTRAMLKMVFCPAFSTAKDDAVCTAAFSYFYIVRIYHITSVYLDKLLIVSLSFKFLVAEMLPVSEQ